MFYSLFASSLSSHNNKEYCFNFSKEQKLSHHTVIIRLDVRKFLCMGYTKITRIRKSAWIVSYWNNFKLSELYWINSKWNNDECVLVFLFVRKKLPPLNLYIVHKALRSKKKKKLQHSFAFSWSLIQEAWKMVACTVQAKIAPREYHVLQNCLLGKCKVGWKSDNWRRIQ